MSIVSCAVRSCFHAGMAAMVFGGAITQGIGGIGFAMVSAPISVLLFPELVPGPLLVLGTALAFLAAARDYRDINWRSFGVIIGGRIVGTIARAADGASHPEAATANPFDDWCARSIVI